MKVHITKPIGRGILLVLLGIVLGIGGSWFVLGHEPQSLPAALVQEAYWRGFRRVYPAPEQPASALVDLLWETLEALEKNYIDTDELDRDTLLYGAIRGLIGAAGDPYTSFFTPQEAEQFLEDASGHFDGIGAEIGIRDGALAVISPLAGSPAEESGLMSGDLILEIDGMRTDDMSLEEAVSRIRGAAGTKVTLVTFREGDEDTHTVTMTRARIELQTLTAETRADGTVVVRLYSFSEDATLRFTERMAALATSEGIVLDLRNNPGGFLDVAVEIASLFLSDGDAVVIERRRGEADVVQYAEGNGPLRDVPVVVLVNRGSASAAEILAGALRDARSVPLIGETTFGKGTVQEFPRLTGGAALKVTVGEWLTPSGTSLREGGLEPDIEAEDDSATPEDEQLQRALEILQGAP